MWQSTESEVLTPRILRALDVAARAHDGHYRKGSDTPYVSHLCGVMYLAAAQGLADDIREDVLIACLLHDTLEDVPECYSAQQMEQDFGPRVLNIVQGVTKDDSLESWRERSDAYLAHLRGASEASVIVSACDKLHNLSSILADHDAYGDKLWARFNSGKSDQQWWYGAVFSVVEQRCPQLPLLGEYLQKLEKLRAL
ncbi:guanosine polyphosphate pyrophosphohydrolase [Corynebacterium striatum]|uniref:Guanosine polyphosphate pyrophosphohydrolase n=1 Tax=Corynebacterium striatum TaxID=43770 RepID=A0A2Z2IYB0_CORST|nr:HD domain-containing protein [Corynebacterium striatum]ART21399.1 guanosine polyphosphate pyrophosphohydrolase [Corynebacterium striatum]